MEQFRPLLVDQTVMALLRTRKRRPEHGVVEAEAGGVWLGSDGKKILVDAYEAACQRSVTGALPGYSGSWRRHIARCWCAQSTNPTTSGAGSPGDDLHHRLRHHRQQTADVRRQNTGIWGYRIQESVFQLRIDTATLARVRSSLAVLISESDDVIHIYPICSSCADRADILGAAIALDHVGSRRGMW